MPVSTHFFTEEDLQGLTAQNLPRHIAIIPDGNRRWAKKTFLTVDEGHKEGADNLIDIVKASYELGIKVLTFFIFSTENWNRPTAEVNTFMQLLEHYLKCQLPLLLENQVRLGWIGSPQGLSKSLLTALSYCKESTAHCTKMDLVLAINYGGRDEIVRIAKKLAAEKKEPEEITESLIASYLDSTKWGDPDLLIRTSGEMRLSNFLLWQLSYSEIYVTPTLWPDFSPKNLLEAVRQYGMRERRLGGG